MKLSKLKSLLVGLLFFSSCVTASPLPAEQAFSLSHAVEKEKLLLVWQMAKGHYLYKEKLKIAGAVEDVSLPVAEAYQDEFFGNVEVYKNELAIEVPIKQQEGKVKVNYQGCTKGFCYPEESKEIDLKTGSIKSVPIEINVGSSEREAQEQTTQYTQVFSGQISVLWFFVFGLGLAFTPCVLPMLPLLSAIVIGGKQRLNTAKALSLSIAYVQGMALTYTLLGLIVAAIGLPFQIALQSPPVLIGLSVLFTLLAASMFGLFEIRLPNKWQQKLNDLSQQQKGGSILSVFVMGMIAGLVASPCTSAPLSGALLYVAQSGDLVKGGVALYLLALGMGLPLILITLFGNRILPKSGDWLLNVKTVFGFVMLALPVFLLSRVYPMAELWLWLGLWLSFLGWILFKVRKNVIKGIVFLIALSSIGYFYHIHGQQLTHNLFTPISTVAELEAHLKNNPTKKVMVDLYADWCVACKEFEKNVFSDENVKKQLSQMLALQIDMSKNSTENSEFMKRYQVMGLPTILFFDSRGELKESRITGYLNAENFERKLHNLNQVH